jgi:TPR repeat protein
VEVAPPPATESKTKASSDLAPVPSEAAAVYPVVSGLDGRKPRGGGWKRVALLALAALAVVTIGALIARQFMDSRSQLEQALAWYTGQAGSVDYTKARQLLESAAGKGDDLATMFKARCIYFGRMAYPKDESLAQRLASTVIAKVENRAKAGNVPAAFLWGEALFEGIAVQKDEKQAAIWLDRACVGSNTISCGVLGFMYEEGKGVTKDLAKAVELYSTACNGKELRGCDHLGIMYENGEGVTKDLNKAVELYRTACNGKELLGCAYLGTMYDNGAGVAQDLDKAVELYRAACNGKELRGCNDLGSRYEDGRGVTKDLGKAIELYRAACDGGDLYGCYRLGFMYSGGKGVAIDAAKAQELYRRACEGGLEDACTALRQPKT